MRRARDSGGVTRRGGGPRKRAARGSDVNPGHFFAAEDEEISSGDEEAPKPPSRLSDADGDDSLDEETVDERRVRYAKRVLAAIAPGDEDRSDVEGDVDEARFAATSRRLEVENERAQGRMRRFLAPLLLRTSFHDDDAIACRGHKRAATCVCLGNDECHAYSGGKDWRIIKWDVESGRRLNTFGNSGDAEATLAVAVSTDERILVSSGARGRIRVWDVRSGSLVKALEGHRGPVTGIAMRIGTHDLYSCGHDRAVKVWNLDELAYIETFFGHQSAVSSIDALSRERAVSCGEDHSIRIWNVAKATQLVYQSGAHGLPIDVVRLVDEDTFVSGGEDGSLSLWRAGRRKPVCVVRMAHNANGAAENEQPRWISAVCACPYSDLVASGSDDGFVLLWKVTERSLEKVASYSTKGIVNGLSIGRSGKFLACAIGQEPRLGRWFSAPLARNGIRILQITRPE